MPEQIWPTKQPDGTIYERHVYKGPQGEGYIDIVYREKAPGVFEKKATHFGPESRNSDTGFVELPEVDERRTKFKRLKEEKAEWKPNTGFEVKPKFKDTIDESGKDKPVKDEKVKDAGSKITE